MSNIANRRWARKKIQTDERGLASFAITMIMMIVITLTVLGFVRITNREQRQSLDNSLSRSAYYAAESGVNDALRLLRANPNAGKKTTCKSPTSGVWTALYAANGNVLNATNNTSYTCLLVDPEPTELQKDLTAGSSWTVPLKSASGAPIQSIDLSWRRLGTVGNVGSCPPPSTPYYTFPVASSWTCPYGVLRYDLVPLGGVNNATTVAQNAMSAFIVPTTAGTGQNIGYVSNYNNMGPGNGAANAYYFGCNNTECTARILAGGAGSNNINMRLLSYYADGHIRIRATDTNGTVSFVGAQTKIDSTGRSSDQIRRIQVTVPNASSNYIPNYMVQTTDTLCKKFTTIPGEVPVSDSIDTACQLN